MASYAILPETLDLAFVRGDEFGMLLDFDMDLTSYSFQTSIYESSIVNGVPTQIGAGTNFTVTNVDIPAGQINLSLQETQTQGLDVSKTYRWFLRWVAPGVVTRTIISGSISLRDP